MRDKAGVLLAVTTLLLGGCTVTRSLPSHGGGRSPDDINARLRGRLAFIVFKDGRTTRGQDVAIRADSITWRPTSEGLRHSSAFSEVERIYYHRAGRGLVVGTAVAVIMGLAIALTPEGDGSVGAYAAPPKPLAIMGLGATSVGLGALAEAKRRYVVYQR